MGMGKAEKYVVATGIRVEKLWAKSRANNSNFYHAEFYYTVNTFVNTITVRCNAQLTHEVLFFALCEKRDQSHFIS